MRRLWVSIPVMLLYSNPCPGAQENKTGQLSTREGFNHSNSSKLYPSVSSCMKKSVVSSVSSLSYAQKKKNRQILSKKNLHSCNYHANTLILVISSWVYHVIQYNCAVYLVCILGLWVQCFLSPLLQCSIFEISLMLRSLIFFVSAIVMISEWNPYLFTGIWKKYNTNHHGLPSIPEIFRYKHISCLAR